MRITSIYLCFLLIAGSWVNAQDSLLSFYERASERALTPKTHFLNSIETNALQEEDTMVSADMIKHFIYAEVMGAGPIISFNYERQITKEKHALAMRGGLFFISTPPWEHIALNAPLSLSILKGKNRNYFEVGGGVSFATILQTDYDHIYYLLGHFILGYRLQTPTFMMRIAYTPFAFLLYSEPWGDFNPSDYVFGIMGVPAWFGISIGGLLSQKPKQR